MSPLGSFFASITVGCFFFFPDLFLFFSITVLLISFYLHYLSWHVAYFSHDILEHINHSYFNPMSDNSMIYIISESGPDVYFVSLDCVFPCLLVCLVIFCWKPDKLYQVIGIEVNRSSVCGFMLLWLGVRTCSMFVVAMGARDFRML